MSDISEANSYGKVAVLAGGASREREISIQSGEAVYGALKARNIDVDYLDLVDLPLDQLKNFDRIFIALHGKGGEDGQIQAILEYLKIPYTGSGRSASAVAMDKVLTKKVWQACGLKVANSMVAKSVEEAKTIASEIGYPLMIKPSLEGSSVGISKVNSPGEVEQAFYDANFSGQQVLLEAYIEGKEYSVGIVRDKIYPSVRLETKRDFYDYQAKYIDEDTEYHCPSGLSEAEEAEIKSIAMRAFDEIGCSGWGRVDFMQDENGEFYLLEVNTVPGLTSHSIVPLAAKNLGLTFDDLAVEILATSFGERF